MNKCEKNSIVIDCVVCLIAKKQRKNKFALLKGLGVREIGLVTIWGLGVVYFVGYSSLIKFKF